MFFPWIKQRKLQQQRRNIGREDDGPMPCKLNCRFFQVVMTHFVIASWKFSTRPFWTSLGTFVAANSNCFLDLPWSKILWSFSSLFCSYCEGYVELFVFFFFTTLVKCHRFSHRNEPVFLLKTEPLVLLFTGPGFFISQWSRNFYRLALFL